jgi:hypothetical protein
MSSPAIVEKSGCAVKKGFAVVLRIVMASDERWAKKAFAKAAWAKKKKAKQQGQPNTNLSPVQFETNLSRMYDNDGNPLNLKHSWIKETFEGH